MEQHGLFDRPRRPLWWIAAGLRAVGRFVRRGIGFASRGPGRMRERARRRRDRTSSRDSSALDGGGLALEAAGEGCGCLAEAALDGLLGLLVIAGLGWLVSQITGGGA